MRKPSRLTTGSASAPAFTQTLSMSRKRILYGCPIAQMSATDVALLPIWGWGPTMGPGHLDPERAAEALARLRPRIGVPIHWGTLRPFYRSARAPFLREPLDAFVAAAARRAPEVDVRVLEPGETLLLAR